MWFRTVGMKVQVHVVQNEGIRKESLKLGKRLGC